MSQKCYVFKCSTTLISGHQTIEYLFTTQRNVVKVNTPLDKGIERFDYESISPDITTKQIIQGAIVKIR